MKKTEAHLNPNSQTAQERDWILVRESRPEDYDGSTRFDRMTPHARLVWLDMSADFVSRNGKARQKTD
ncbi:MAG: hypothetical protein WC661_17010 [Opitutaceae bacterium]|jgi:hypothetical protein